MQIDINNYSTILFDLGGVVVDIDIDRTYSHFAKLSNKEKVKEVLDSDLVIDFEKGLLTPDEFYERVCSVLEIGISKDEFFDIWNMILTNVYSERISWINDLAKTHNLFLLSNTNAPHIEKTNEILNNEFGLGLNDLFAKTYLSYEIGMHKPEKEIFEHVLNNSKIEAKDILYIDDTEINTKTASKLGIHTLAIEQNEHFYRYLKK